MGVIIAFVVAVLGMHVVYNVFCPMRGRIPMVIRHAIALILGTLLIAALMPLVVLMLSSKPTTSVEDLVVGYLLAAVLVVGVAIVAIRTAMRGMMLLNAEKAWTEQCRQREEEGRARFYAEAREREGLEGEIMAPLPIPPLS